MRRKSLWKQTVAVALSVTMLLGLPAEVTFAEESIAESSTEIVSETESAEDTESVTEEASETEETSESEEVEEDTENSATETEEAEATEVEETETVAETETTEVTEETEEATETAATEAEETVTEELEKEAEEEKETEIVEVVSEEKDATAAKNFKYEENDDGTITITGYTGSDTKVVIPEKIDGKSVTSIDNWAFEECRKLISVELPDSITSIGNGVFYECRKLVDIKIPSGVTSIGDNAFVSCWSLTSIDIPNSVTNIGKHAFAASGLTSIEISANVTSIGSAAFTQCSAISSIKVDADNEVYTSDGNNCIIEKSSNILILGCSSTVIPDGVTGIADRAFSGADITTIEIPKSVTSIGEDAFFECTKLTSIKIPDSVKSIGEYAFGNSGLVSVTLPGNITSIGNLLFSGCESLTSIEIPKKVTSIGESAFEGCKNLTGIKIPDSVKSIGEAAFEGCDNLVIYCSTDSAAGKYAKKNNISYKSLKEWENTAQTVTYTITFNGNGSTSGSTKKMSSCKYGKKYTLTKNGFKKKGYTFKGWNTKKDGSGKSYKNKAEVKNLSSESGGKVTLYAQWKKTKYTITYNLNKGKNNKSNPASYTITTKTVKLKNPTRKGYTFKGWYSDKKCTKKVTQIKKGSTGNVTLYAKWKKK